MIKYRATWSDSYHLSDVLRQNNINFKMQVISYTNVVYIFDDSDAVRVDRVCKGLAKKVEGGEK